MTKKGSTSQMITNVIERGNGFDVKVGDYAYHSGSGKAYRVTRVFEMGFYSNGLHYLLPVEVEEIGDAYSIPEDLFDDAWDLSDPKL